MRCHQFHPLPKIHKTLKKPPERPIVSGVHGPTESLSKFVDHWLQSIVTYLPSNIQDATHMLHTLQQFRKGVRLVTTDVVGLYTRIPLQ